MIIIVDTIILKDIFGNFDVFPLIESLSLLRALCGAGDTKRRLSNWDCQSLDIGWVNLQAGGYDVLFQKRLLSTHPFSKWVLLNIILLMKFLLKTFLDFSFSREYLCGLKWSFWEVIINMVVVQYRNPHHHGIDADEGVGFSEKSATIIDQKRQKEFNRSFGFKFKW